MPHGIATYGHIKEYVIYLNSGQVVSAHNTLPEAFAVVASMMKYVAYRPVFPVTIEALDTADICHPLARISWENASPGHFSEGN